MKKLERIRYNNTMNSWNIEEESYQVTKTRKVINYK